MSKIVKCEYCDEEIEIKPSAVGRTKNYYCSRKCYNLARRTYKTNSCLICKDKFKVWINEVNFKKFCSDECEKEFEYQIKNDNVNINEKYRKRECKYCGNEFWAFGFKGPNYCSLKCKTNYSKEKNMITLICKECGNEFKTHRKDSKYCSVSCSSKKNAREQRLGIDIRPDEVWNKGLTAETDERIKKMREKGAKTFKENYKKGKFKIHCDGENLTKVHKRNITIGTTNAILNGKRKPVSSPYNGVKSGFRKDIGHFVRSSWEANFSRILKYLNREYFYEPKYFVLSDKTTYTPDFYDVKNNCYYEIKGFWTKESKNKFKLFKKNYPNIKIKVINKKQYYRIIKYFEDKIDLE
ncbi:MAG: hypothetical protein ACOCRK_01390 [bacterium]